MAEVKDGVMNVLEGSLSAASGVRPGAVTRASYIPSTVPGMRTLWNVVGSRLKLDCHRDSGVHAGLRDELREERAVGRQAIGEVVAHRGVYCVAAKGRNCAS